MIMTCLLYINKSLHRVSIIVDYVKITYKEYVVLNSRDMQTIREW